MLADRLLRVPKLDAIDAIYASLHTTEPADFKRVMGVSGAAAVQRHMVALAAHGYRVQINFSLGGYNASAFAGVLRFAIANRLRLKAIALIRPTDAATFYAGDRQWVDPHFIASTMADHGFEVVGSKEGFGGRSIIYELTAGAGSAGVAAGERFRVEIKNVAAGRLVTDFCGGCKHAATCGEGMYALRVGVDGVWKPCLLRQERFAAVLPPAADLPRSSGGVSEMDGSYEAQVLRLVGAMVGDASRTWYREGAPE